MEIESILVAIMSGVDVSHSDVKGLSNSIDSQIDLTYPPCILIDDYNDVIKFNCLNSEDGFILQNYLIDILNDCYDNGLINFTPKITCIITRDEYIPISDSTEHYWVEISW